MVAWFDHKRFFRNLLVAILIDLVAILILMTVMYSIVTERLNKNCFVLCCWSLQPKCYFLKLIPVWIFTAITENNHLLHCSGFWKNDSMCEPLCLDEQGSSKSSNYTLQFLLKALAIFSQWKASGQLGLTAETFSACIYHWSQCFLDLAPHWQVYEFINVLSRKFISDPIEGPFGWYSQTNAGNLYMSSPPLF